MYDRPTSLIIIQPTPFCNIDCSYCYLPQRADRTRLSHERLQTVLERVLSFPTLSRCVTLVWHAGEPLVLGIDYYKAAFDVIEEVRPRDLVVEHAFQTNGLLIDDAWCAFFREWNAGVGLSIDGPAHIHDRARKTRSGQGTHRRVLAGLKTLQRNGIPFYVITVLTAASLQDPDGMFAFFRDSDIRDIGFNVEEVEGRNVQSSLSGADEKLLADFLKRFGELIEEHHFPISIRELEETVVAIQGLDREIPISNQLQPFGIITIDVLGNVYTFAPELAGYSSPDFATFAIGNIFEHTFTELCASPVLARMTEQIAAGVEKCRAECQYFPVCGGGAPANKLFENGTFASSETMHCRLTRKQMTDFVLGTIESRYASRRP